MAVIPNLNLTTIAARLSGHAPLLQEPGQRGHAAVAMLIKEGPSSPEVLFIIRAEHDRDPWSGNIGFPGGRLNDTNESPRQAAIRETFEELSVDLRPERYLGRLDDLFGATMPVLVSCFVYHVAEPLILNPNHEVAATFWMPLEKLLEIERHQQRSFHFHDKMHSLPVVELLEPQQPPLWGITYRLVGSFFDVCSIDFGLPAAERP